MKFRPPLSLPLLRHRRANLKDQFKLIVGALVFPAQTLRWRSFLHQNAAVARLANRYPRVLHKIYRPYLSRHLDCADRVKVMIRHYQHIARFGLDALVVRAAASPVTMARFEGKDRAQFELRLSAANVGHREGELTLQLCYSGAPVYAACVTLSSTRGNSWIYLGALQGVRAVDGANTIKVVTKALHGYRPRQWMVALVRDLGDYFGCKTLRMVSNRNRVAINWRRSRRISSDYDAMWREMHAHPRADGDFEMSCAAASAAVSTDVPTHKRAEARRRNELLTSACLQMRACLDIHRAPAGPVRPTNQRTATPALLLSRLNPNA